jgi:hypothetical protein
MDKPLPTSRHDAPDLDAARPQRQGVRHAGAGRWVLAVLVGCIALLASAPVAGAAGTAKIKGTVTEFGGGAVENVQVQIYNTSGEFVVGSTSTKAGGAYEVEGLPEGGYKVKFSDAPTFAVQYYSDQRSLASANLVSVKEGEAKEGINAALKKPGEISGKVTNAGGKPVPDIRVQVYGNLEEEFEEFGAVTNVNGEYTLEGLPEGEYKVGFLPGATAYTAQYYNAQPSLENANPVAVTAGTNKEGIGAVLKEGGKITGTVTDSVAHKGLEKIGVFAYSSSGGGFASTNANGEYTVTGLPTGSYKLEFYWEFSKSEREACVHAPRCIPKYITQYFSGQASEATANPVGASEGSTTSAINVTMVPSAPVNTVVPAVAGSSTLGSLLSCSNGSWTGETFSLSTGWPLTSPFTYQWLRGATAIAGATSSTYTVQTADLGTGLVCEVTASIEAGKASAKSISFAVPKPVPAVKSTASKLTVAKNATKVSIACAKATCAGKVEVVERIVVKHHKGKKTIVLAKGSYSLAAGKTSAITLRLTAPGKKKLAQARGHRASGKLLITVKGGKSFEKTVQLSLKK